MSSRAIASGALEKVVNSQSQSTQHSMINVSAWYPLCIFIKMWSQLFERSTYSMSSLGLVSLCGTNRVHLKNVLTRPSSSMVHGLNLPALTRWHLTKQRKENDYCMKRGSRLRSDFSTQDTKHRLRSSLDSLLNVNVLLQMRRICWRSYSITLQHLSHHLCSVLYNKGLFQEQKKEKKKPPLHSCFYVHTSRIQLRATLG